MLLQENIRDALHPRAIVVYLQSDNGELFAYADNPPQEATTLSNSAAGIAELAGREGPLELIPDEMLGTQLARLDPECLVGPADIAARGGRSAADIPFPEMSASTSPRRPEPKSRKS